MMEDRVFCKHHPGKHVEYFCNIHEKPLCHECKKDGHNSCKEISNIPAVISDVKNRNIYEDTSHLLQNHLNQVNFLPARIASNLLKLEREKVVFKNTLTHYRRKVDKHLDDLETSILKEYQNIYDEQCSNLKKLQTFYLEQIKQLEHYLWELENVSGLSEIESFLTIKRISGDSEAVLNQDDVSEISIDFTMTKEMLTFQNISALGTIHIHKKLPIEIKGPPLLAEDTIVSLEIKPRFEFLKKLDIQTEKDELEVIDIKELDEGVLILSNRLSENILVHDMNKNTTRELSIGEYPDSIAVIDKMVIAVTQGRRNVMIVGVVTGRVLNRFDMDDDVEGLTTVQAKLIVNCKTKGLQILNIDGNFIGSIPHITGRLYLCAVSSGEIVCADQVNNRLTCVRLDGEIVFSLSDRNLIAPYGITVDKHGDIFVVGIDSSNIYRVSSDGKETCKIMTSNNRLQRPFVLLILKDGRLLVSNKSGRDVELYQQRNVHVQ
ncbi:uncharacterized protein LOC127730146 [Mytilus californianus]|uniref:uncharacterized protein LOC127730146 n=1 Tax=Mytilus californianus TaxID=6549 RepID=UPI002245E989|nr:uncharacterized protein LOC127730146 [Mytilus californianus]XP_052094311.1 uncharacterized protein LOC127730146 [Mytilus californianus]